MSFTRAAAREIAMDLAATDPVPVGTLHSFAFRGLGKPKIALDEKVLPGWNQLYPQYEMTPADHRSLVTTHGDSIDATPRKRGDELLALYELHRATLSTERMSAVVKHFATRWNKWKQETGVADFTDLIEGCLNSVPVAPGHPNVIYVDEAQDLTPLEWRLIHKWGSNAARLVTVGDPDQTVFTWRGASSAGLTEPTVPKEHVTVLSQSYRVPREVHGRAVRWIERIQGRDIIEYLPRPAEGMVRVSKGSWLEPQAVITEAESRLNQEDVMFLASCRYMLRRLINQLRARGIPFHNPYRPSEPEWNPLGPETIAESLRAFLQRTREPFWTVEEIRTWTEPLKHGEMMRRGAASLIERMVAEGVQNVDAATLQLLLTNEAVEAGVRGDIEWWQRYLQPGRLRSARYPLTVVRNYGAEALFQRPKAIVGTVHSVKGGESDVVYVFPDLSRSGAKEWRGRPLARANVIRLFYVAMTRARETLVLCSPATRHAPNL